MAIKESKYRLRKTLENVGGYVKFGISLVSSFLCFAVSWSFVVKVFLGYG